MTPMHRPSFALMAETGPGTVRLRVTGDLDHETTGELVGAVRLHLGGRQAPDDLHLDFAALSTCDSTGLSGLLLVHRLAVARGTRLHLDDRPPFLERFLDITGTLEHLTAPPAEESPGRAEDSGRRPGAV
ncbi:STAS domain-containing protein [Streptomyces sp. CNQ085]|uniref:STAS domain-containing protein n=1 Tax=Streptomyces sp. CNQ085 TaxID=2886944 RepID=UPI001F50F568|nr:STAS domain-containing protein [Streptomyces sp. CNQ085]MCI0385970.1 STAS domain-containing protein [Streptomyces sp. CNQ085]